MSWITSNAAFSFAFTFGFTYAFTFTLGFALGFIIVIVCGGVMVIGLVIGAALVPTIPGEGARNTKAGWRRLAPFLPARGRIA